MFECRLASLRCRKMRPVSFAIFLTDRLGLPVSASCSGRARTSAMVTSSAASSTDSLEDWANANETATFSTGSLVLSTMTLLSILAMRGAGGVSAASVSAAGSEASGVSYLKSMNSESSTWSVSVSSSPTATSPLRRSAPEMGKMALSERGSEQLTSASMMRCSCSSVQPHSKTEPYGNRNTSRSAPARVEKWQCTTSVYDTMDTLSPSLRHRASCSNSSTAPSRSSVSNEQKADMRLCPSR
mmetsp:Transcript_8955/g.29647  ORF Transcript_8955/g.29647 Transcript_8955/m.29647 type:complete len:242 (+) Transcript_8955:934-1659(+)